MDREIAVAPRRKSGTTGAEAAAEPAAGAAKSVPGAEPLLRDEPVVAEPPPAETAPPDPEPTKVPRQPAPGARRGSGPALVVGIVVLALGLGGGFLLSREGGPLSTGRLAELSAAQAALTTELAEVSAQAQAAEARAATSAGAADLLALQARVTEAESALAIAKAETERLKAEIEELRRRPPEVAGDRLSEAAVAAYARELAAMRKMVADELAKIRAEAAEAVKSTVAAAEAGASADALAALSEIDTALDTGAGFGAALDRLAALDAGLPLDPLRPFAEGVEPLSALQRDFPAVARSALEAATAAGGDGGLGGFLKAQLGMRSLSPKDGAGADAVLSRAEAHLRDADLARAVGELGGLAGPAADKVQPWRARAETRLAALAAHADLARKVRD
jgi:hypothetical protein